MVGRNRSLHQQEYKEDVVYLFQPPRATYIPNASPFSLKLETWLRMNEIPYEPSVRSVTQTSINRPPENPDPLRISLLRWEFLKANTMDMLNTSKKGQLPFVELNGKEIPDSNFIITELADHFKKESKLDDLQKATAQAFESLIEDSLYWVLAVIRSQHCDTLLNDASLVRMLPAPLRPVRNLAARVFSSKLKSKTFHQGIGRHSLEEVNSIGAKLLWAVSTFLADKDYLFGEKPSWVDATAFGHLSQFWYTPINSEMKKHLETDCQNIVAYLERMKTAYWPDWTELCAAPAPKSVREKNSTGGKTNETENKKPTDQEATEQPAATVELKADLSGSNPKVLADVAEAQ